MVFEPRTLAPNRSIENALTCTKLLAVLEIGKSCQTKIQRRNEMQVLTKHVLTITMNIKSLRKWNDCQKIVITTRSALKITSSLLTRNSFFLEHEIRNFSNEPRTLKLHWGSSSSTLNERLKIGIRIQGIRTRPGYRERSSEYKISLNWEILWNEKDSTTQKMLKEMRRRIFWLLQKLRTGMFLKAQQFLEEDYAFYEEFFEDNVTLLNGISSFS